MCIITTITTLKNEMQAEMDQRGKHIEDLDERMTALKSRHGMGK